MRTTRIGLLLAALFLAVPALAQQSWQGTRTEKVFDKILTVTGRDSTARIDVRNAHQIALMVKVNPGAGTATPFATLAISVRGHLDDVTDSNSVFIWSPNTGRNIAGATDSITYGVYGPITAVAPHRSEIVVTTAHSATGQRGSFIPLRGQDGVTVHPPFISLNVRQIVGSGSARVQIWVVGYQP